LGSGRGIGVSSKLIASPILAIKRLTFGGNCIFHPSPAAVCAPAILVAFATLDDLSMNMGNRSAKRQGLAAGSAIEFA
jgi:hypothetical protein